MKDILFNFFYNLDLRETDNGRKKEMGGGGGGGEEADRKVSGVVAVLQFVKTNMNILSKKVVAFFKRKYDLLLFSMARNRYL